MLKFHHQQILDPTTVIGPNVEIDDQTVIIQSHVNMFLAIQKLEKIIDIYPFASIGNDPQDMKYKGEKTKLINRRKIIL